MSPGTAWSFALMHGEQRRGSAVEQHESKSRAVVGPSRRRRRERGASLPEYAILLGALALGLVFALDVATTGTTDKVGGFDVTEGDVALAPSTTAASTTTSTGPAVTTTLPIATTTSTSTTTTTTTPKYAVFLSPGSSSSSASSWTMKVNVYVSLGGVAQKNVTVSGNVVAHVTAATSCKTGPSGFCTITMTGIPLTRLTAGFVVTGTSPGPWDGGPDAIVINKP